MKRAGWLEGVSACSGLQASGDGHSLAWMRAARRFHVQESPSATCTASDAPRILFEPIHQPKELHGATYRAEGLKTSPSALERVPMAPSRGPKWAVLVLMMLVVSQCGAAALGVACIARVPAPTRAHAPPSRPTPPLQASAAAEGTSTQGGVLCQGELRRGTHGGPPVLRQRRRPAYPAAKGST
jgi:hypothetical protein